MANKRASLSVLDSTETEQIPDSVKVVREYRKIEWEKALKEAGGDKEKALKRLMKPIM